MSLFEISYLKIRGNRPPLAVISHGVVQRRHELHGRHRRGRWRGLDLLPSLLRRLRLLLRLLLRFFLLRRLLLLPRRLHLRILLGLGGRRRRRRIQDILRTSLGVARKVWILPRDRIAVLHEPRVDLILDQLAHVVAVGFANRAFHLRHRAVQLGGAFRL